MKNSPYRDKILLVITFDEHGGCYDHVPPPMLHDTADISASQSNEKK